MTDRPSWAPQGIDITVPSVSRIYDYYLGGSHNFEVDRDAARVAMTALPGLPKVAQANRAAMRRAVRLAVDNGITQFLDIGSGVPTFGNVHEVAQGLHPDARVVYVDNDPVAVSHSRAVLAGNPDAEIVAADLRDPRAILEAPETRRLLDLDKPVALMLIAVLHFIRDDENPGGIIATLRDAFAPGSMMVVTHSRPAPEDGQAEGLAGFTAVYQRTSSPIHHRTPEQLEPLFAGFEIVEPGIVPLPYWRPETPPSDEDIDPAVMLGIVGVGQKA